MLKNRVTIFIDDLGLPKSRFAKKSESVYQR